MTAFPTGFRDERAVAAVPKGIALLLGLSLAAQVAWRLAAPDAVERNAVLPPAPTVASLRLASFGETAALARMAMLYLQSFDLRAGNETPYQRLDYDRLLQWLSSIQQADPLSEYPLFMAARIYAEVPDDLKARKMLAFIHREFLLDPDRRWPWLAHAALLAKHRLNDLPLARRYAADVARLTRGPNLPFWASQMEAFILEDMGELEAARIMLGGLLDSGRIKDPEELRFLQLRLQQLEERLRKRQTGKVSESVSPPTPTVEFSSVGAE